MPGPIYELCSRLLSQHKHDHRQHNEKAEDSEDAQVKAETEQLFEEADIRVLREIVKDKLPPKIVSQDAAEANQLAKAAIENLNSTRTEEPWAPTLAGMVHQVVRPLLDRLFEWTYQRDQGSSDLDPAMILDGKLRRCLSELFVALVRLSECCPDQHTARLQLSGFMEQCRISQIYFDLYLSSYRVKGPFQWQETKCIFLKDSKTSSAETREQQRICSLVDRCTSKALHLCLPGSSKDSITFLDTDAPISDAAPTMSLGVLLQDGYFKKGEGGKLMPSHKASLFRNLALSMLHLSWEEWLQMTWNSNSVFFKFSGNNVLDIDQPFLSCRLSHREDDNNSRQSKEDTERDDDEPFEDNESTEDGDWELTRQNTSGDVPCDLHLLYFACLLLEIELGECIQAKSIYKGSESYKLYRTVDKLIMPKESLTARESNPDEAAQQEPATIPIALRNAVEACLHPDGLRATRNGKTDNGAGARDYIFYSIANPLNTYSSNLRPVIDERGEFKLDNRAVGGAVESYVAEVMLYDETDTLVVDPKKKTKKQEYAEEFLKFMGKFNEQYIEPLLGRSTEHLPKHRQRKIRIAIIDSGLDKKNSHIRGVNSSQRPGEGSRIKGSRSWIGGENDVLDTFGHGTVVAYLLLKIAPAAEIYIARVSEGKTIPKENVGYIAEAIRHAAKQWDVDIISLSLGIDGVDEDMDKAINEVTNPPDGSNPKLIFAAASNNKGGNSRRAYPASRSGVICVHASDGRGGGTSDLNPTREEYDGNFATLGIDILFKWGPQKLLKSGTSFATPIAAGIAANVMEYARHHMELSARNMVDLYSPKGMEDIFHLMKQSREDYGYIQPWDLWRDKGDKIGEVLKNTIVYGYSAARR